MRPFSPKQDRRQNIHSILSIDAGPIIIGQAFEFDDEGNQAVKALRAEGYRIILINSNPAAIMTDPEMADTTYIEPITPEIVAKIIEQKRAACPDDKLVLLPAMGGQTALNTALALERNGPLAKHTVGMIGAKAEDRPTTDQLSNHFPEDKPGLGRQPNIPMPGQPT